MWCDKDPCNHGLSKNDLCFFALAFYRQTMQEAFFELSRNPDKSMQLLHQATYWWELYLQRRQASRRVL